MQLPPEDEIQRIVRSALAEDVGSGDVTTLSTVPETSISAAKMVAREPMMVSGLDITIKAFANISADLQFQKVVADGACVEKGLVLLRISGSTRALLTGERVALNFVQRLSGIA